MILRLISVRRPRRDGVGPKCEEGLDIVHWGGHLRWSPGPMQEVLGYWRLFQCCETSTSLSLEQ